MKRSFLYILVFCLGCSGFERKDKATDSVIEQKRSKVPSVPKDFIQYAKSFDFPVGKPDAKGYYNAQAFGKNDHLGDDWNAMTGGNSDLGDPIYSIGTGKVVFVKNLSGGWGKVVRIVHYLENGKTYESLYAHCDSILVNKNDWVAKGFRIATIGNAEGAYLAHLHLEIRDSIGMAIGGGYSKDRTGYVDPTAFINGNRVIQ